MHDVYLVNSHRGGCYLEATERLASDVAGERLPIWQIHDSIGTRFLPPCSKIGQSSTWTSSACKVIAALLRGARSGQASPPRPLSRSPSLRNPLNQTG